MTKKWIKNGVFASDTIETDGCVVCNPTEEMLKAAGYEEYAEPVPTEAEKLAQRKVEKVAEIDRYDSSPAVNGFRLNGADRWLDIEKRQSIAYAIGVLERNNIDEVDIWFGTERVTLACADAKSMLEKLEVYAKETNDVTHEHKAAVEGMASAEDIEAYDIAEGYPQMLEFNY